MGLKLLGSSQPSFLYIKIVKACFQVVEKIFWDEQYEIIWWITFLKIMLSFKMMTLMCSRGHGEPKDFILFTIVVISLKVGRLVSNALFGCCNFSVHVGISNALRLHSHFNFLWKKFSHVSLLKDALITYYFSKLLRQLFIVVDTIRYHNGFFILFANKVSYIT